MNMTQLTDLSDMEILQMQWDILEQLKQKRVDSNAPVVLDAPLVEEKPNSLLNKLEEHFGGKATIPKKTESSQRKRRRSLPKETLPGGLKLYASQCTLYKKEPYYIGGGRIMIYNEICPLSIGQLAHLSDHFNEIPKEPGKKRINWFKKQYGVKVTESIDRLIWNLFKDRFQNVYRDYYQENYRINFDGKGNLRKPKR